MSEKRIKLIEDGLKSLNPLKIDIIDEGHLHVGHAGAKSGGHFKLYIVNNEFNGRSMIERHKLIYRKEVKNEHNETPPHRHPLQMQLYINMSHRSPLQKTNLSHL